MADVVNLNKVRKAKLKQHETAKAAQNRVVFGISTKVRKLDKLNEVRATRKLDQNLRQLDADNKKS